MTRLTRILEEKARDIGFLSVGIAPAVEPPRAAFLETWLARGMAADMDYLKRDPERRRNPRLYWPAARSIVALSVSYAPTVAEVPAGPLDGVIARYARLPDYHRWLKRQLHRLGAFLQAESPGLHYLACVDTSPLLERPLASLAGIGWIGKNGMLVNRWWGSFTFLGFLLLDTDLGASQSAPHPNHCGTCRACLEACPTGALVAPYVLDARRCLAYQTIENRGPIPRSLRAALGNRVFGCDLCQEVCPWTKKARRPPVEAHREPRPELARVDLIEAACDTQDTFAARWRGTPVKRAKRHGMARNIAVALGNSMDRDRAVRTLGRMIADDHPLVRAHAAWSLGRQGGGGARRLLEQALRRETDLEVQSEMTQALETG